MVVGSAAGADVASERPVSENHVMQDSECEEGEQPQWSESSGDEEAHGIGHRLHPVASVLLGLASGLLVSVMLVALLPRTSSSALRGAQMSQTAAPSMHDEDPWVGSLHVLAASTMAGSAVAGCWHSLGGIFAACWNCIGSTAAGCLGAIGGCICSCWNAVGHCFWSCYVTVGDWLHGCGGCWWNVGYLMRDCCGVFSQCMANTVGIFTGLIASIWNCIGSCLGGCWGACGAFLGRCCPC